MMKFLRSDRSPMYKQVSSHQASEPAVASRRSSPSRTGSPSTPRDAPGSRRPLSGVQPTPEQRERRRVVSARMFYGTAIALGASVFLPWASVLSLASVHPSGGAIVFLLVFTGLYAGTGYTVQTRRAGRALVVGAWVLNALLVINVFAVFNAVGQGDGMVSPAAGLYVATIGAVAAICGTVQLHRSRAHATADVSPTGAGPSQRS